MCDFVFARYVAELKKAWCSTVANVDLIDLLYYAITEPAGLSNKNGEPFHCATGTASLLMNRKSEVPEIIRNHSHDESVKKTIVGYFEKGVVSRLHESKVESLIFALSEMIRSSNMADTRKAALLALSPDSQLAEFLAKAYQEVLVLPNKWDVAKEDESVAVSSLPTRFPQLSRLSIPEVVGQDERRYVEALLDVYKEQVGDDSLDIAKLVGHARQRRHFDRQRSEFYAAESVHRGTRDIYTEDEPDQFAVFQEEIYDGVVDTYERDFSHGIDRLTSVMEQAAVVSVQRSWLCRDTDWIGVKEKKGICHFLVNDGTLPGWVDPDE